MSRMRIISGIFEKQVKDILKNIQVLVLFLVFPIVALVMTNAIPEEMGQSTFFISIFASMHFVFTPLVAVVSIIAEEKEKGTLRTLIMSNVKPLDYLISIGGCMFVCTAISGLSFALIGGYTGERLVNFIIAMVIGSSCSIILGLTLGGFSKNTAAANALAVPIGMIFGFLPMIAAFNDIVMKISKFTYGQQVSNLIASTSLDISLSSALIILANLFIIFIAFVFVFRKNRIEE